MYSRTSPIMIKFAFGILNLVSRIYKSYFNFENTFYIYLLLVPASLKYLSSLWLVLAMIAISYTFFIHLESKLFKIYWLFILKLDILPGSK